MKASHRETILEFLHKCPLAVISTTKKDTDKSESALVAFCNTDRFEVIFETFFDARKYSNLKNNNYISLTTGFNPEVHITFQYEGVAEEQLGEEIIKCKEMFSKKNTPCSEEFLNNPKVRFFKAKPKWLRYSDYTAKAPFVVEENFKDL